jgi:predicted glycoside hydrolase/deacetylase ChbG (UPF0249 family)
MNVFDILDGSTRPKAPAIAGATPEHRLAGRKLAAIHDMHMSALDETKAMMKLVEAGGSQVARLVDQIDALELAKNYRRFGNLCGRECQFLDYHHTSEDLEIFPVLRARGGEAMNLVVARLTQEHAVVGELLEELAAKATTLRANPGRDSFLSAKTTFELLYSVIRSHFGYEQAELEEALGFYNAI